MQRLFIGVVAVLMTALAGIGTVVYANQPAPVQQEGSASPTLRVIPSTGQQGDTHTILSNGLSAGQTVTVRIVRDETGAEVYSAQRTADTNGRLELEIFTTADDPPGTYTISIVADGEELNTTQLVVEPPEGLSGAITISPEAAPPGSTHTISISDVRQFLDLRVVVRDEAGETVFDTPVRATVDGTASVRYTSADDAAPGIYTVAAIAVNENNDVIDETVLTIGDTADVGDATVSAMPQEVPQDTQFSVDVMGLTPDSAFSLEIVLDASGEIVYSTDRSVDSDGNFSIDLASSQDDVPGAYTVRVLQDGAVVAEGALEIVEAAPPEATEQFAQPEADSTITLEVIPEEASAGTDIFVTGSGFAAGDTVAVSITQGETTLDSRDVTADDNGIFIYNFPVPADVPAGEYAVIASVGGEDVSEDTFTVLADTAQTDAPADTIDLSVNPAEGPRGTSHIITATGIAPSTEATMSILFDGASVYEETVTADENGTVAISVASEPNDPLGVYTVELRQDGEILDAAELTITQDTAEATPEAELTDEPEEVFDEVTVTIAPSSGTQGTSHEVRVEGLAPNETVTLNVIYADESVFQTTREADPTGTIILTLATASDDPAGIYTVEVLREEDVIATADLTVEEGAAQPDATESPADDVTLTIEPGSGPIETDYTITATGLNADETVTFEILFDNNEVFVSQKVADESGTAELVITTQEGDEIGQYVVNLLREETVLASETFEATGEVAETTTPDPTLDATVLIEPTSAARGNSYTVTASNLEPSTDYTIDVLFGGESVFMVDRASDVNGRIILNLTTAESDPTGTYTVEVSRADTVVASGSFDVLAEGETPPTATPETAPESTPAPTAVPEDAGTAGNIFTDRLTSNTPSASYTFSGEAGEEVVLSLTSADFDAFLTLQDTNGVELATGDDTGALPDARIGPFALPYSGDYRVLVSSFAYAESNTPEPGAFRLVIERVTTDTLAYGESTSIALSDAVFGSYLSFDAQAGDTFSATVDSANSVDTELRLIAPDGTVVAQDDDGGAGFDPELSQFTAATTGTYTLAVSAFVPGTSGTAEVALMLDGQTTLTDAERTVRLDSKQAAETLILEAVSGEEIQLSITVENGLPNDLTVRVVQDEEELMAYSTTRGVPPRLTLGFVVPRNGPVTITMSDPSGAVSTLAVSINRIQP